MKIDKLKQLIEYLINIEKSDVPKDIIDNIDDDYVKLKKSSHFYRIFYNKDKKFKDKYNLKLPYEIREQGKYKVLMVKYRIK